jgi:hypothetical protein
MGAIFTQILVGNGRGQVTGCRAQGAETRDGRGEMEARTVTGHKRQGAETRDRRWKIEAVTGYKPQETFFQLGTLNLEH